VVYGISDKFSEDISIVAARNNVKVRKEVIMDGLLAQTVA
jgi:hypothetical protein